jgi:hypothetical protein
MIRNIFTKVIKFINIRNLLILLILVIIPIVYVFIKEYYDGKNKANQLQKKKQTEKIIADSLAKVIEWPKVSIPQINVESFSIRTKFVNGIMLYSIIISSEVGERIKVSRDSYNGKLFSIKFLDKDGFEIFNFDLRSNDCVDILSNEGLNSGYSADGSIGLNGGLYSQFASIEVEWFR